MTELLGCDACYDYKMTAVCLLVLPRPQRLPVLPELASGKTLASTEALLSLD